MAQSTMKGTRSVLGSRVRMATHCPVFIDHWCRCLARIGQLYATHLAFCLIGFYSKSTWSWIFDVHHKPQSTDEHFCVYPNSHCVDYREEAAD